MRVALIGTSNALLTAGLSHGLARSPLVTALRNFSLGASLSLHAAVMARNADLGRFDVCLLDFAVNETPFVNGAGISRHALRVYARAVAGKAIAEGCLPVVLVLPRRDAEEQQRLVTAHHLKLARELNLPYLDGIALVGRLVNRLGLERAMLFKNDSHLTRWFAVALGHELAQALRHVVRQRTPFVEDPWSFTRFEAVSAFALVPPERRLRRSSTLLTMKFAELRQGEALRLPCPGAVHGFWYNSRGSAGVLRFSGETVAHVDMRGVEADGRRRFLAQAIALRAPVAPLDGAVTLETVPLSAVPDTSRRGLDLTTPNKATLPDLGFVELGGVIAEEPEPVRLSHRPAPASHINLAEHMPGTALHAAIDIALTHDLRYGTPTITPTPAPDDGEAFS